LAISGTSEVVVLTRSYSHIIGKESILNKAKDNLSVDWRYIVILAVILGLPAMPVIKDLWQLWHSDKNFEGLLLVPIMCGIIFYKNRKDFIECTPRPQKNILYFLPLTSGAMLAVSYYDFTRIAGLLLVINFLIASLGLFGYSKYKLFMIPLLFLMLMVPPPLRIVDFTIVNLQALFSYLIEPTFLVFSERFIGCHGFEFWFSGIDYPMIIAPECSGIRSLMGFIILASFTAILDRHSIFNISLMIMVGVITTLTLNFFRIIITICLRLYGMENYSVGFWHGLLGILMFVIGCTILSNFSFFLHSDLKQGKIINV